MLFIYVFFGHKKSAQVCFMWLVKTFILVISRCVSQRTLVLVPLKQRGQLDTVSLGQRELAVGKVMFSFFKNNQAYWNSVACRVWKKLSTQVLVHKVYFLLCWSKEHLKFIYLACDQSQWLHLKHLRTDCLLFT